MANKWDNPFNRAADPVGYQAYTMTRAFSGQPDGKTADQLAATEISKAIGNATEAGASLELKAPWE